MGCAMRVHSILGYGFLESAYGDALEIEFKKADIPYVRDAKAVGEEFFRLAYGKHGTVDRSVKWKFAS